MTMDLSADEENTGKLFQQSNTSFIWRNFNTNNGNSSPEDSSNNNNNNSLEPSQYSPRPQQGISPNLQPLPNSIRQSNNNSPRQVIPPSRNSLFMPDLSRSSQNDVRPVNPAIQGSPALNYNSPNVDDSGKNDIISDLQYEQLLSKNQIFFIKKLN